jgi:hypothetical protein
VPVALDRPRRHLHRAGRRAHRLDAAVRLDAAGPVKTQSEILQRPPTWWPREFTWDNFAQWFGPLDIGHFFTNSIVVAL